MLRDFLAKGWMTAIAKSGVAHPDRQMITLQRLIWDTIMDPLWQERNKIMHQNKNEYNGAEDERFSGRIIWYVEHRHKLMNHHDQFLMEIDLTRLGGMRRATKRKWIRHLDIAQKAWKIEREQRRGNQQVVTRFFGQKNATGEDWAQI